MPKTAKDSIDFIHGRKLKANGLEGYELAHKVFETVRGRPRKGSKAEGSSSKSLRLPDATWTDLAVEAKKRKVTVHKLLRIFVAERLYTTSWAEASAEAQARKAATASPANDRKSPHKPRKPHRAA